MQLKFSLRAQKDLAAILNYLMMEGGKDVAYLVGKRIQEKCKEICTAPGMGKRQPHRPDIRKVIVGPHKIFYRVEAGHIVIRRIWDGRRGTNPKI